MGSVCQVSLRGCSGRGGVEENPEVADKYVSRVFGNLLGLPFCLRQNLETPSKYAQNNLDYLQPI